MSSNSNREAFIKRKIEQYYRGNITPRYVIDLIVLILNISLTFALVMSVIQFLITGDGKAVTFDFIDSSIDFIMLLGYSNFLLVCCKDVHYRDGKLIIKFKRKLLAVLWFSAFSIVEIVIYRFLGLNLLDINTPYIILPCIVISYINDPLIPLIDYQTKDTGKKNSDNTDDSDDNESEAHFNKLV